MQIISNDFILFEEKISPKSREVLFKHNLKQIIKFIFISSNIISLNSSDEITLFIIIFYLNWLFLSDECTNYGRRNSYGAQRHIAQSKSYHKCCLF